MAVTKYYTVNGRIRGESTNGVSTTYGFDALGSVTGTYDESGNPQNTYQWAPYGTQIAKSGTAIDPKFGWNGGSGYRTTSRTYSSHYVRRRHFDNLAAQWSTVDPLWPKQRSYAYRAGRPIVAADPSGLRGPLSLGEDLGIPRELQLGPSAGQSAEAAGAAEAAEAAGVGIAGEVLAALSVGVFVVEAGVALGYLLYEGLDDITNGLYSQWIGDLIAPYFGSGELPVSSKEQVQQYAQQIGHPITAQRTGVQRASGKLPRTLKKTASDPCQDKFDECNDATGGGGGFGAWCLFCKWQCDRSGMGIWSTDDCNFKEWWWNNGWKKKTTV